MNSRQRLPNRRAAIAFDFEHGGQNFRAHLGFYPGGAPAELFLDSTKPDSAIDAFGADSAILISLLLQHGASVAEIGHALRRTPNGRPASMIAAAIDAVAAAVSS
jgi:hypothetical protein